MNCWHFYNNIGPISGWNWPIMTIEEMFLLLILFYTLFASLYRSRKINWWQTKRRSNGNVFRSYREWVAYLCTFIDAITLYIQFDVYKKSQARRNAKPIQTKDMGSVIEFLVSCDFTTCCCCCRCRCCCFCTVVISKIKKERKKWNILFWIFYVSQL